MPTRAWKAIVPVLLLAAAAVGFASAYARDDDPLPLYVTSISAQFDPRLTQALAKIDGPGRQLLALRSYLRSASHLAERWSWTREQIEAFDGSPEQRDLQQEIDRVRTVFAAANPGFELYANSQAFEAFLSGHRPVPIPTIAAPGLSLHGQMRAIDFQVHQGGRVVAGPNTATIATDWAAAGWATKLDAAVRAGSDNFVGPQASPPAPWHYADVPEAAARE